MGQATDPKCKSFELTQLVSSKMERAGQDVILGFFVKKKIKKKKKSAN